MKIKSFVVVIAVVVILVVVYILANKAKNEQANLPIYNFGNQEQYICAQEKTFRARFSDYVAEITFPDSTVYNFDKVSEDDSGIRYFFDGDQKMTFWIKDLSAFIERDGVTIYKGCRLNGGLLNYPEETFGQSEVYPADIIGEYFACLPYVHEPKTKKVCVAGLRSDTGIFYKLDFNKLSQTLPKLKNGDRISGSGMVTPVGLLNTDDWRNYEIKGIFSVTELRTFSDDPLSSCNSVGGKYNAQYSECEGVSASQCTVIGGTFNECASACRHDPNAQVCTMQCVQVCEF